MTVHITQSLTPLCVLIAQSGLTLCDPLTYSPPGSSVHGIFQARLLEWVAISFSNHISSCCHFLRFLPYEAPLCQQISVTYMLFSCYSVFVSLTLDSARY